MNGIFHPFVKTVAARFFHPDRIVTVHPNDFLETLHEINIPMPYFLKTNCARPFDVIPNYYYMIDSASFAFDQSAGQGNKL
jgi:hypothetical protein